MHIVNSSIDSRYHNYKRYFRAERLSQVLAHNLNVSTSDSIYIYTCYHNESTKIDASKINLISYRFHKIGQKHTQFIPEYAHVDEFVN